MKTVAKERKKVVCLFNSFISLAGGDVRFIEIFRRATGFDYVVITSALGEQLCRKKQLVASYIKTTQESHPQGVLSTYFMRTLKAVSLKTPVYNGDVIYATSDFLPDVIPAFLYKKKNKCVKWVQVIHHLYQNPFVRVGSFLANLFGYLSQQISFILMKRHVDSVIVVNPIVKQQLSKMGFCNENIFVNYNGVDFEKIQRFQPSITMYNGVFLGRLNISKGLFDLLDIWKGVVAKNPYAVLALIGGGDSQIEKKLRAAIIASNLEKNVVVFGYLDDAQTFGILKSSQIFVFPSHEEGFGIAVLEAMACGLPVIAWDLPVFRALFPNGLLRIPLGNTEAFSKKILQLLQDSSLRLNLSRQAFRVSKRYSWDTIVKYELDVLTGRRITIRGNTL